jgi:hypothetical protein
MKCKRVPPPILYILNKQLPSMRDKGEKMDMRIMEVGKPLIPGITSYPDGQIVADINGGVLFIRIAYSTPTESEVKNIHEGPSAFSIVEIGDVIFILFKFGELNWMDAPYSIHLSSPNTDVPMASYKEDTRLPVYEVFDSHGNHLEEADLKGNINTEKADKRKKI